MTTTINRQKIVAEELIRSYVRKRIKENINRKLIAEDIIRSKIRTMLLEAEVGSTLQQRFSVY